MYTERSSLSAAIVMEKEGVTPSQCYAIPPEREDAMTLVSQMFWRWTIAFLALIYVVATQANASRPATVRKQSNDADGEGEVDTGVAGRQTSMPTTHIGGLAGRGHRGKQTRKQYIHLDALNEDVEPEIKEPSLRPLSQKATRRAKWSRLLLELLPAAVFVSLLITMMSRARPVTRVHETVTNFLYRQGVDAARQLQEFRDEQQREIEAEFVDIPPDLE
ncbi:hypothetical protein TGGT1_236890 [Toxoplasma gondii GT1]|uniref:Transmembrane protein n=8 Tax=Toxoplasma gondii TaxID=5811 RepID=B9PVY2_TOXGV|nr:hypothetical protein TGGT1_236890 [Toxoplasma gondii GT1]ESS31014.1 putative transmembrane protein [Toxoplasma gondii VEG]KAF4640180.1 hypothetical protein TGRH88_041050 [Toxoplasma gondii]KFG36674.1 putative transmembrane protein [Toxoplasma gondii p89]KFG44112.1 putative transmembrane protein [Toxoplasma gondii FOU]PUA84903.1 putative transmembrane protein [Toxoplasma gondii TgCATBr9]RQX70108.1 putative transmembrane protein [Toxoplasma gondii CAST]